MEVKVFGGGNVIDSQHEIGSKNSEFILRYLEEEGLKCAARDLNGDYPRRIEYSPATGKVVRRLLGRTDSEPIVREETEYATSISKTRKAAGEVELFGDFK
jgi:chemotaxis protein CheD